MILLDTSAWVEFLRGTGSAVNLRVREALRASEIATTDPVVMEVLAGARSSGELRDLSGLLGRACSVPCRSADFLAASEIFRATRSAGEPVRNSLDCLIAAVAIRQDVRLLHADRDFDTIARHSRLETA